MITSEVEAGYEDNGRQKLVEYTRRSSSVRIWIRRLAWFGGISYPMSTNILEVAIRE